MKFTQRPIPVEAVFFDSIETALRFLDGHYGVIGRDFIVVDTREGPIKAKIGEHWLVKAGEHNYWPVKRDSFSALFEEDAS